MSPNPPNPHIHKSGASFVCPLLLASNLPLIVTIPPRRTPFLLLVLLIFLNLTTTYSLSSPNTLLTKPQPNPLLHPDITPPNPLPMPSITGGSTPSGLRHAIFPIYGREIFKFVLIAGIKFFVVFVLTLTRDTKDTLMVTECGAEAIAFMKVYGVLPCAAGFIALYSKLDQLFGDNKAGLFYATCLPFFAFFVLFDRVIYPNKDFLHPSMDAVVSVVGSSGVFSKIIAHWTSALFYVVSELYSSVSIGILFWGYANSVVGVDQARRFYPLFGQMSSLGPIAAGQYVVHYASKAKDFQGSLDRLTAIITLSGFGICAFHAMSERFLSSSSGASASPAKKAKKAKPKMSMAESFSFLASSPYLRLLATLVVGYGLSINFTEIIWKSLVKKQYPSAMEYQHFMGTFSSVVGVTTFLVIFLGGNIIKHLGWKTGALATPAIMSILAVPFFGCLLIGGVDNPTSLKVAVIIGTVQSLLSKVSEGC